jgi:hypothetical protein
MSHDISTALRLAEHFRQENENLRSQLSMALSEPRYPMVVMFAGWKVERTADRSICTISPTGEARVWTATHALFPLLTSIADYQP